MRKRYIALLLSTVLSLSLLTGCGGSDKEIKNHSQDFSKEEAENTVYGEVSEVTENVITIKVGTQNKNAQPDENSSMLELTGEEQEIQITENTVIKRHAMRGGSGKMTGNEQLLERPNGEVPSGESQEQPNGKSPSGEPLQHSGGENSLKEKSEEISISDLSEGDAVRVMFAEDGSAKEITVISGTREGGNMVQDSQPENYAAVTEYKEDIQMEGESIASEGTDENAVLISNGASAELKNFTISRKSQNSTGGDSSSFYGVGAAVLAEEGTAYISGSTIETDAAGGAGTFAYGNGTVYAADTSIVTQQNTSGGIHAAGGGKLYAWDLEVETNGESAAAIRSDRGGGTMIVDGGSYISNGVGSPAVYSTADIAINNASLVANGSEAVCIEGLNSLHLYHSDLTGTMGEDQRNDCTWNVILYQSMSGDSKVGNSTFEMQEGTLKANHGGMFYTTNTESTILLSEVTIENASDSSFFLKCTGNQNQRGWGTAGNNGADCLFTANKQSMEGNIIWDSVSQLDFYMRDNSTLTGAVVQDESCAGDGGEGFCNLYLGENCTWTVTGDSILSSLSSEGKIVDAAGKDVTIQGSDGTVFVQGDSTYTITTETYNSTVDLSGAAQVSDWADYQIEKPSQLI